MRKLLFMAALLSASVCQGQEKSQPPASGARELFYSATGPKDALPPVVPSAPPPKTSKTPAAVSHLGLRYTVLLVGQGADKGQIVDPGRNFRKGDCLALNLEANRSGYLYVLAKESSGDWSPLFPTAPDESNRIDPGQVARTPRRGCFEIDDPPGTETLFVVLSRDPRDIHELAESIQSPGAKANAAVDHVAQQFGTRELSYSATDEPAPQAAPKKEPERATYVVSGSEKPASTLVTRVEIHHR